MSNSDRNFSSILRAFDSNTLTYDWPKRILPLFSSNVFYLAMMRAEFLHMFKHGKKPGTGQVFH